MRGRSAIDSVRIRMPIFGKIWLKYQVAMFARTLSTLLTEAFRGAVAGDGGAVDYEQRISKGSVFFGHDGAGRQRALAKSLEETKVFPGAFDGDDRGGESTGRAAADAEFGGGVF